MDLRIPTNTMLSYANVPSWQSAPVRLQMGESPRTVTDVRGSGAKTSAVSGHSECQTCKNRKYKDGSDDPTVSFQSATKLSPEIADTMVRAHEQEHVAHEQVKAKEEGRRVVSQQVAIHYAICPECGRSYVAGGTTTTVTKTSTGGSYGTSRQTAGGVLDARV
jgi:hypothetical protein